MTAKEVAQFKDALTLLAYRMLPPDWGEEGLKAQVSRAAFEGIQSRKKSKLVFLLGAGCSQQYGLPSFTELLGYLWEDLHLRHIPGRRLRLEVLRDQLDKFWQAQGPEDRWRTLGHYLNNRVDGATCPGYLHLARLAEAGYVKAIVNMNFDTLLEQAMNHTGVEYKVATSFLVKDDHKVVIYKPHGTIGWVDSENVIEGMLRAVQEVIEPKSEQRRQELRQIFLRAYKAFDEEKKALPVRAQDVVEASEDLIQVCSAYLDSEQPEEGENPGISRLKKAAEELAEKNRDPIRVHNELILDIANSDLFSEPREQLKAQDLLTSHDVISIGYSGIDAKIAAALRAFPPGKDPKDKKLFVVNVSRPDPRLLLVMAERSSQDLLITGEDGAFESFMGDLSSTLREWEQGPISEEIASEDQEVRPPTNYMTRAEREALKDCLRLALDIRHSMNVAERSTMSIEEHGKDIFGTCLSLVQHAGICLSSAEKYLLHCAAFLHDLGYYRGYTRAKASENPGWTLLRCHGKHTADLLQDRFSENPETLSGIIPRTYGVDAKQFERLLCTLCAGHSGLVEVEPIEDSCIRVDEAQVPVRFSLILSVLALAEDLSEGHPFLPSPDLVGPASEESSWAIVDPVLDLYLRQKERPIEFKKERGRISVRRKEKKKEEECKDRPHTIRWLLTMAEHHRRRFDDAAKRVGGWGISLVYQNAVPQLPSVDLPDSAELPQLLDHLEALLCSALQENLEDAVGRITCDVPGEACILLDLVSIYTMSMQGDQWVRVEPRVQLERDPGSGGSEPDVVDVALDRARRALEHEQTIFNQGLLRHYLPRKRQRSLAANPMQNLFRDSFEKIVYPAWRFFARNWHDGIEVLLMARACFDLGSSHLRGETLQGVQRILDEKIDGDKENQFVFGHDRCTLCTSRLLYVLSNARRLAPTKFPHLDETIRGLLRYMLSLEERDPIWWGLGTTPAARGHIHSADYLAWAARSVGFCLSVDRDLQARGKGEWLTGACKLDKGDLERLLRQRWDHLFSAERGDLLDDRAEEPHSFIFGHVAIACLDLLRYDPEIRKLACDDPEGQVRAMAGKLETEARKIGILSQISKFFLWPHQLLLDHTNLRLDDTNPNSAAEEAVRICYKCVHSPVWIKNGGDTGSWGFNVKNTQAIVTSLVEFWRYVLQSEAQQKRFEEIFLFLDPELSRSTLV